MARKSQTTSIRDRIKARNRGIVNEEVRDLGEVPILKLDVDAMIELGNLPIKLQNRAMVARCVVDEEGKPIYANADAVGEEDYELFQQLLTACYKVNGIKGKIDAASGN
jgi:hypothetical protein